VSIHRKGRKERKGSPFTTEDTENTEKCHRGAGHTGGGGFATSVKVRERGARFRTRAEIVDDGATDKFKLATVIADIASIVYKS
jgi:hypothetical protein